MQRESIHSSNTVDFVDNGIVGIRFEINRASILAVIPYDEVVAKVFSIMPPL
jgi:hypothetical protein